VSARPSRAPHKKHDVVEAWALDSQEREFKAGLEILSPFFDARDFDLRIYPPVPDGGGTVYSAQFVWGNHSVTLIHRASLSDVAYSIGAMSIEHAAYLQALGVLMGATFPALTDDPLEDYRGLLADLEERVTPFFEEPDRDFMEIAEIHGHRGHPWLPGT
jgi:hypothetical protein